MFVERFNISVISIVKIESIFTCVNSVLFIIAIYCCCLEFSKFELELGMKNDSGKNILSIWMGFVSSSANLSSTIE